MTENERPEEGPRVIMYGVGCAVAAIIVGVVIGVTIWNLVAR